MTASLLATAAVGAFAETDFSDVPEDHPFATEIGWLVENEITTGFPDDTFRPTIPVTRMAGVTWLYRWAGSPDVDEPAGFTDLDNVPPEFATAIAWAVDAGITTGYADDTFRPTNAVTRRAFAAWLFRAAGEPEGDFAAAAAAAFDDVTVDTTFANEIGWMVENEITTGWPDGTFRPGNNVTRQAGAAFLFRFNALFEDVDAELTVITTGFATQGPGNNFVWASDGESVFNFPATAGSSYFVDGVASSRTAFGNALAPGDTVVVTEDGDDYIFELTNVAIILEGVVSFVGGDVGLIDPASGVTIQPISSDIYADQTYTVDGVVATENQFLASLSTGDYLVAEVLVAGETLGVWDDWAFRHHLTNQTISGEPTAYLGGATAVIDPNPDDVYSPALAALTPPFAPAFVGASFAVTAEPADAYTVNGTTVNKAQFDTALNAAVAEGDAVLTFDRVAGAATYDLVRNPSPVAPLTGLVIGGDWNGTDVGDTDLATITIQTSPTATPVDIGVSSASAVTIDGVVSTFGEFRDAVSIGDTIVYQAADVEPGFFNVAESVSLSNADLSGRLVALTVAASTTTATVTTVDGYNVTFTFGPDEDAPFGIAAADRYQVNAEALTTYETFTSRLGVNLVNNNITFTIVEGVDAGSETLLFRATGVPPAA